jgi:hypothetical protein
VARTRAALEASGLGALLVFDQHNVRYITSTVIGEWARDKLTRWALLTGNGEPWLWVGDECALPSRALDKGDSIGFEVGLRLPKADDFDPGWITAGEFSNERNSLCIMVHYGAMASGTTESVEPWLDRR